MLSALMSFAFRTAIAIAAMLSCFQAAAAPASALGEETSNSPGAVATDGRSPTSVSGSEPSTTSSGNRTIDSLLNGQSPESGDAGGADRPAKKLVEGTLPAKVVAGAAAASAASPFAELQAVILGNRDAKAKQPAAEQNPDMAVARRREMEQLSNAPRSAQSEGSAAGMSSESNGFAVKVARYIREHRLLVIGASLVILAAVWGAATFASQRRR